MTDGAGGVRARDPRYHSWVCLKDWDEEEMLSCGIDRNEWACFRWAREGEGGWEEGGEERGGGRGMEGQQGGRG